MTVDNPTPNDSPSPVDVPTVTDVPTPTDVPTANDVPSPTDSGVAASATYGAVLSARQEVPAVNTPALGVGRFSFDPGTRTLTYHITHNVGMATAAHIHMGAAGASGGVVVAFPSAASPMMGTVMIPAANVDALNNGTLYVNVHSMAHPGGEIRGQIVTANYYSMLDGMSEVPPVMTAARGVGIGSYNAMSGMFTYHFEHTVMNATAAHLHRGAPGMSGGVAVAFTGATSPMMGTISIAMADQATFMSGGLYANIHSMANGGGEIRGQVNRIAF